MSKRDLFEKIERMNREADEETHRELTRQRQEKDRIKLDQAHRKFLEMSEIPALRVGDFIWRDVSAEMGPVISCIDVKTEVKVPPGFMRMGRGAQDDFIFRARWGFPALMAPHWVARSSIEFGMVCFCDRLPGDLLIGFKVKSISKTGKTARVEIVEADDHVSMLSALYIHYDDMCKKIEAVKPELSFSNLISIATLLGRHGRGDRP